MRRIGVFVVAVVVGGACAEPPNVPAPPRAVTAAYVGSERCAACHADIYERWKRTRMANVVRDPRTHPDAILPDLSQPNPLVTFTREDIAFVYGSKWKQRYFTRVDGELYPLPAQWDVTHQTWRKYFVADGTDWWVPLYPKDNLKRPTGPLCDGCHSVDYDVRTRTPHEWNVGCEKCHGPGSEHVRAPRAANVVNPAKLDPEHEDQVCIQCHSQGRPTRPPDDGRAYDWPVGFQVGLELDDFWKLEDATPGQTTFTHFPDGTAHKNRMQGNDFVQSVMYRHGVTCASCHDVHGTKNDADLVAPPNVLCLTCHSPGGPRGPRATSIEGHTHHAPTSAGSRCIACHMPAIEQTIGDVNVRAHTFRFIPPSSSGTPDPCTLCHRDRTSAWAADALRAFTGSERRTPSP